MATGCQGCGPRGWPTNLLKARSIADHDGGGSTESSALRPTAPLRASAVICGVHAVTPTRPIRTAWHAIGSDRVHVGGVQALRALLHLVLDLRALSERPKAAAGDRGMVDEHVLALVVGRDEAEALVVAEPLHGPSGHPRTSGCPSAALPTDGCTGVC